MVNGRRQRGKKHKSDSKEASYSIVDVKAKKVRDVALYARRNKGMTNTDIAKIFQIKRSTVAKYKEMYEKKIPFGRPGRPPLLDKKAIEEVKQVTRDRVLCNQTLLLTSSDEHDQLNLKQFLIDKINETSERRGHTKAVFGLNKTQINTLCKQCDLKIVSTQRTTGSRAISCSSVYNAASTLVLWKSFATLGVNPRCLLNLDATSVLITLMDESWDKRFANRGVIPIDLKVIDDKSSA